MNRPVLTIITRYLPSRSNMLHACLKSVLEQTRPDYEHVVLPGLAGLEATNAVLRDALSRVRGEYVWLVDDDDRVVWPACVETLASHLEQNLAPDYFLVFYDRCDLVVPAPPSVEGAPVHGKISGSCVIVRRDRFLETIDAFRPDERGEDDTGWLKHLYQTSECYIRLNVIGAQSQAGGPGQGRSETELLGGDDHGHV